MRSLAQHHVAAPGWVASPEVRAGAALAAGWIAAWTFFLVAVAEPGARLHASAPGADALAGAVAQRGEPVGGARR